MGLVLKATVPEKCAEKLGVDINIVSYIKLHHKIA